MEGRPRVAVVGGCNGAGKSTAAKLILEDSLKIPIFVNADEIARGLSGFNQSSALVEASRITLIRLRELSEKKCSFGFETTLAGRTYVPFLRDLKNKGYEIIIYYFWVETVEIAMRRVAYRVAAGGHGVPIEVQKQRYPRSVSNFLKLYSPLATSWKAYINSYASGPEVIASGTDDGAFNIVRPDLWHSLIRSGSHE